MKIYDKIILKTKINFILDNKKKEKIMTKKKTLLTFVFAICLMIPAMFMLTACGHSHKATEKWVSDATYHWHACEDENCKEQLEKTEHTWGEWTETKASTCTEKGTEESTCSVCGHKGTRELALAEHEYTYTYNSSTCTIVAPTEETEGKMLLKCNNCDHKEQIFVYPVISDENYASNCTNVNNNGWKFSYTLKDEYYTNNQVSNDIKVMTRQFDIDVDLFEDNLGCNLIELRETETNDTMSFSYNFTAPGKYYIAMKDSSATKAFQSITFTSATGEATSLSSMSVYNESGAKPSDDNDETNIFAWTTTYVSNSIANKTANFLIVVDVKTAGTGTLTIGLAK